MCFAYEAEPPELPTHRCLAPVAGGAAAERLVLTSVEGTEFSAALAQSPDGADRAAVVILPDVRGLYPFYERLAERFADAGNSAIVVDYFGRTAGLGPRDDQFDFWPHTLATEQATIQADIGAAITALAARTGATRFVTVGFCFGGTNSFLAAANNELGLAGAVGFYGGLDPGKHGMSITSPVDSAPETVVPVLGLFGGADDSIPPARIDAFVRGLEESGVEHEVHVYPGAPHSFFDRSYEEHGLASADAWERVLDFIGRLER